MKRRLLFLLIALGGLCGAAGGEDWLQFRGLNGGASLDSDPLPGKLSLEQHLLWKTPVGKGHSSPVIAGERVLLTTLRDKKLLTMSLDAATGQIQWEAETPYEKLEKTHRIGSPATPSCVTDGSLVISFFGSSGMQAHDLQGELLWRRPLGPFDNGFGAAGSPVLVDDRVVLIQDHDTGSYLAAYDKRSGEQVWRVDRSEFRRNYSSPVVWEQDGQKQIVVAGTGQVNAYDAKTGGHLWMVLRGSRVISATPVVAADGRLYVANSGGGEAANQPSFKQLLATADANGNGRMEKDELPKSIIRSFMEQFDRDKNSSLDEAEYESIRQTMTYAKPVAMAIQPGGRGDITDSHVAWMTHKSIPRNASPLVVDGKVFLIRDGGILVVLDARSGKQLAAGRLRGSGKFFSSPVYGDGKIFAISDTGKLNVITAKADWEQLATIDLQQDAYATPAIAHGRLYVRTVSHLWCFGKR